MPNQQRPAMKSVNFLLPVQKFQKLKVYTTCKSITLRELCADIINAWMEQNEEEICKAIDINGFNN
jgi:hypothetical protein